MGEENGRRRHGRSSDEIRRDIERTRADMDSTVDALEERLSPGHLLDEVWSRIHGGEGLSSIADALRDHRARHARESLGELLDRSPLAMGAIAFGLGLAAGLTAPSSSAEDRLMGRVSDTLKGEAKRVANETTASARKVARATTNAVVHEVEHAKHPEEGAARTAVSDLRVVAGQVLDSAKETARESAERVGLGVESLKREASSATSRTTDALRQQLKEIRRRSRGG